MTLAEAARRIVAMTGGRCRWLGGDADAVLRASLCEAGVVFTSGRSTDWSLGVIGAARSTNADTLSNLLSSARKAVALLVDATPCTRPGVREVIDRQALIRGFRRHPLLFRAVDYEDLETESGWLLVPLERIPAAVLARYPLDALAPHRDLHMDMTREAGRRSDAHLARYDFASRRLAPRGRVLDAACGLGYGADMLARTGHARSVVGVDIDRTSVAYASRCFARRANVRFETGDVRRLGGFRSRSFDGIVSFETLEHIDGPERALDEWRRVLRPGGLLIASVPYRWTAGESLGPHHVDWYDASKLIEVCSRFFVVEAMWAQTAGGGPFCTHAPRRWRPMPVVGVEPEEPAEWVVIACRQVDVGGPRRRSTWVLLAPGVPQLATMMASMRAKRLRAEGATVWGQSPVVDDAFSGAMRQVASAFGCGYAGNLFTDPGVAEAGDPLDYRPSDARGRRGCGARIRRAYPILGSFTGGRLMMTVRPNMPGDYALLAAAGASEVCLVTDGIQNHLAVRDFTGSAGFADNVLARLPTEAPVHCPPWLAGEAAAIGRVAVLPERLCRRVLARIGRVPAASALAKEAAGPASAFGGVVVSQHLARSGLMSPEAEVVFYVHQVRTLLTRASGRVLFKAHPRDPSQKLEALQRALIPAGGRVRFTAGEESHLPLEALAALARPGRRLLVWGTSSTALLGVRRWPGTTVTCVDAEYVENEVRRQARQFSQRHGLALVTLRFADPLIGPVERAVLSRRLQRISHPGPPDAVRGNPGGEPSSVVREREHLRGELSQCRAECVRLQADLCASRARELSSLIDSVGRLERRPVVVWGAGAAGQRLVALLLPRAVSPKAIVDSDPAKTGTSVLGIPVVSPDELGKRHLARAFVLVASQFAAQIVATLRDAGWREGAGFVAVEPADVFALEHVSAEAAGARPA